MAKKKAAPGKRKRNRLTDLRCAWKHATPEQRREFVAWMFDSTLAPYEVAKGPYDAAS